MADLRTRAEPAAQCSLPKRVESDAKIVKYQVRDDDDDDGAASPVSLGAENATRIRVKEARARARGRDVEHSGEEDHEPGGAAACGERVAGQGPTGRRDRGPGPRERGAWSAALVDGAPRLQPRASQTSTT